MPEWLRPTGGFGIGMQSGFMIADEIRIRTKCIDETEGREIILYSLQNQDVLKSEEEM